MIERHLRIWARSTEDNFMSWTTSPLFLLQHAIRREETDIPRSRAEDVKISILDTSKILRNTFMSVEALIEAYNMRSEGIIQPRFYYHGEYLSQGQVTIPEGAMTTLTLQDLQNSGLYDFYPDLRLEKRMLYIRVSQLRERHRSSRTIPTKDEFNKAFALADKCCKEARFQPVLFTLLLALRPRALVGIETERRLDGLLLSK
jgi:hypothetical protein